MAAPAPANLNRVQARHFGAKGKPISGYFRKLGANEIEAEASKQHDKSKTTDEERKRKAAEVAAAQPAKRPVGRPPLLGFPG